MIGAALYLCKFKPNLINSALSFERGIAKLQLVDACMHTLAEKTAASSSENEKYVRIRRGVGPKHEVSGSMAECTAKRRKLSKNDDGYIDFDFIQGLDALSECLFSKARDVLT